VSGYYTAFQKYDIHIEIIHFFVIIKGTITKNLITICSDRIFLKINPIRRSTG